jgi:hypothetical protein
MLLSLAGSLLAISKAACNNDHSASALNVVGHTLLVEMFFITNPVENILLSCDVSIAHSL